MLAGGTPILVHNTSPAREINVSRSKYPESAQHIEDSQAAGYPAELTINRKGAKANRMDSLRGMPRVPGKDRDVPRPS